MSVVSTRPEIKGRNKKMKKNESLSERQRIFFLCFKLTPWKS